MPDIPSIDTSAEKIVRVLAAGGFEYAVIGGLAVILQGHDRFTRDVDAVVWDLDERLDELVDLVQRNGFRLAEPGSLSQVRSGRILHLFAEDDTPVDIFLGFLPFERETIDRAVSMTLQRGTEARVSTPEDLIIMKLIAARPRDKYDIVALLGLYPGVDRERIRRTVSEYAEALDRPDLIEGLTEFLA